MAAEKSSAMTARKSALALLLMVPVPSLGVLVGMYLVPGTLLGQGLFFLAKAWIFLFPVAWRVVVDKERPSLSPARHGGFGLGAALGAGISVVIVAGYFLVGRRLIDASHLREIVGGIGLESPVVYLAGAAYWILVNSILEEYVWRWFVVSKLRDLCRAEAAVILSALAFTLHHIVAMWAYFGVAMVVIASLGIFIGGAAWSWCYVKYRSIWPGYLSHAIVDVAVFGLGYHILFG